MSRISDDASEYTAVISSVASELRSARAEIARLTEENARLEADNVLLSTCASAKVAEQLRRAEARLAAATTVTDAEAVIAAAVVRDEGGCGLTINGQRTFCDDAFAPADIRQKRCDCRIIGRAALTAFVAFKQAGAGEGDAVVDRLLSDPRVNPAPRQEPQR